MIFSSISPAFQWAQSPDSVFLNVKFSHKWDTPATLGCEADKVDFADRSLRFATVCASKRKNFALNLDLLRDIDAEVRAPLSPSLYMYQPLLFRCSSHYHCRFHTLISCLLPSPCHRCLHLDSMCKYLCTIVITISKYSNTRYGALVHQYS